MALVSLGRAEKLRENMHGPYRLQAGPQKGVERRVGKIVRDILKSFG